MSPMFGLVSYTCFHGGERAHPAQDQAMEKRRIEQGKRRFKVLQEQARVVRKGDQFIVSQQDNLSLQIVECFFLLYSLSV